MIFLYYKLYLFFYILSEINYFIIHSIFQLKNLVPLYIITRIFNKIFLRITHFSIRGRKIRLILRNIRITKNL
jgi:hypothetical protein